MADGRAGVRKASCDSCFFGRHLLCALAQGAPCSTYRPDHPDGLRPPRQLRFTFAHERQMQVAWAFPSANEQVALHG